MALLLYEQLEKGEIEPARIINHFQEAEEQKMAAAMFQTSFGQEMRTEEKKKAITDLVIKIKEYSLEKQSAQNTDINRLQSLVLQKKALQKEVKLHIS